MAIQKLPTVARSKRHKPLEIDHPFLNEEAVNLIKRFTPARTFLGLGRFAAYRDRGDYIWRIGYGSTKMGKRYVHGGDKASEAQVLEQFLIDLKEFTDQVVPCVYMPMNSKRRAAIISYAHSIGLAAFKECELRELINTNASKKQIIKEWSPYINKVYQYAEPRLIERRRVELNYYLAPDKEIPTFYPHRCEAQHQCLLNLAETWNQSPNQIKAVEYLERKLLDWDPTGETMRRFWRYWNQPPGGLGSSRNL